MNSITMICIALGISVLAFVLGFGTCAFIMRKIMQENDESKSRVLKDYMALLASYNENKIKLDINAKN